MRAPWPRMVVERGERGFTLIELMIVMVVLGILAGIVLLGVDAFRSDAKTAACRADAHNLATANVAYKLQHNGADAPDPDALVTGGYITNGPSSGITFVNGVIDTSTCGSQQVALTPPPFHLTAVTGAANENGASNNWSSDVTVTAVDDQSQPVAGAHISGSWADGATPGDCVADGTGTCTIHTHHTVSDFSTGSTWTGAGTTVACVGGAGTTTTCTVS